MSENFRVHFQESPVALVKVIVIVLMKVITHINIIEPIMVKVCDRNTKAITESTADDPGSFGYVCEMVPIVPE